MARYQQVDVSCPNCHAECLLDVKNIEGEILVANCFNCLSNFAVETTVTVTAKEYKIPGMSRAADEQ